ncbi:MAG: hypothetical protein IPP94_18005 [Ignavibacteria bacterium]|nr:hypothetical protein [Ignavibacteria bacterium]
MSAKKRHFIKPAEPDADASGAGQQAEKGDNLILVENIVRELLRGMSAAALAKAAEVNVITVRKIAKGDSKRVSKKVLFAIQKFSNRHRTADAEAPVPATRGRKPNAAPTSALERVDKGLIFPLPDAVPSEASGFFSVSAIQAEITALERRIGILRQLQVLAKEL